MTKQAVFWHQPWLRIVGLTLAALLLIIIVRSVSAQEPDAVYRYTVQNGDTLYTIAVAYQVDLTELMQANSLLNPNFVFPGQELILPGVPLPTPTLVFTNYSPAPIEPTKTPTPTPSPTATPHAVISNTVTNTLALSSSNTAGVTTTASLTPTAVVPIEHTVQAGDTLFAIAANYGTTIGDILIANGLSDPDRLEVGQLLLIPIGPPPTPAPPPPPFETVEFSEPSIIQGRTQVLYVSLVSTGTVSGEYEGEPLLFQGGGTQFWALLPIHPLATPSRYPLTLRATTATTETVTYFQQVNVVSGPYSTETIILDAQRGQLLDPQLIQTEWAKISSLWSVVSPQQLWNGYFWYPVNMEASYITSAFGTRRSYNGGPVNAVHSGTDFGGGVGTPIYAPAPGRVVLAEALTVRGNAVLIDHGLGLFTGYWHQSEIVVEEGQSVAQGDLIGYIGSTGLVTGPHLHWEMRINGISVEPLQWIEQVIP